MFCKMLFGLIATFICIPGITGQTLSGDQSEACENYMASCVPCTQDVYCYCSRRTGVVVRLPCVESSNNNRYLKVYTETRDGSKTLICPTDHEYTSHLPSKTNLTSKSLIKHYCSCKEQVENVFPFQCCPDLRNMEKTTAPPQGCSNQQPFNNHSSTPLLCPIPVSNCNLEIPDSKDVRIKSSNPKQLDQTVTINWDLDDVTILIMMVGAADCLMLFVVGLEIAVLVFLPISI